MRNNNEEEMNGTVRIFMSPKSDENGQKFLFKDQKDFMIELDKFWYTCKYIHMCVSIDVFLCFCYFS